jgi:hypothetical protein
MSVVSYSILLKKPGVVIAQWTGLKNGDTGQPFCGPSFPDRSVQVKGTFGSGGNCAIEGSNDITSPTWAVLKDALKADTLLNITAAGINCVGENVYQHRPNVTAGDGTTDLTVTMLMATMRE